MDGVVVVVLACRYCTWVWKGGLFFEIYILKYVTSDELSITFRPLLETQVRYNFWWAKYCETGFLIFHHLIKSFLLLFMYYYLVTVLHNLISWYSIIIISVWVSAYLWLVYLKQLLITYKKIVSWNVATFGYIWSKYSD
jgi:hypothetical protein